LDGIVNVVVVVAPRDAVFVDLPPPSIATRGVVQRGRGERRRRRRRRPTTSTGSSSVGGWDEEWKDDGDDGGVVATNASRYHARPASRGGRRRRGGCRRARQIEDGRDHDGFPLERAGERNCKKEKNKDWSEGDEKIPRRNK
jgi:hypothetical protein